MKRVIKTDKAPAAVGPYSQAIEVENTLYISGQIALDPSSCFVREVNALKMHYWFSMIYGLKFCNLGVPFYF